MEIPINFNMFTSDKEGITLFDLRNDTDEFSKCKCIHCGSVNNVYHDHNNGEFICVDCMRDYNLLGRKI